RQGHGECGLAGIEAGGERRDQPGRGRDPGHRDGAQRDCGERRHLVREPPGGGGILKGRRAAEHRDEGRGQRALREQVAQQIRDAEGDGERVHDAPAPEERREDLLARQAEHAAAEHRDPDDPAAPAPGDETKVTTGAHARIAPEQTPPAAAEPARAGAATVNLRVRAPEPGHFSMATRHYREVVKRIRESRVDVLVNLTCGMGGYICVGRQGLADTPAPGTDFVSQEDRMRHVIELCAEGLYRPEIATLDCGTLNFGDGNRAYVSTPDYCRQGATILRDLGVTLELEIFDTGNLWFVKQMIKEGLVPAPAVIQLCTAIPYGVRADLA